MLTMYGIMTEQEMQKSLVTLIVAQKGLWHSNCRHLDAPSGLFAWHDTTSQVS